MILAFVAAAWFAGVVVAALGAGPYWLLPAVAAGATLCGLTLIGRLHSAAAVGLLAVVFLAGLARYEWSKPSSAPTGVALFNDGASVSLRGTVIEEPEQRQASQRLHLKIESSETDRGWQDDSGGVLVTARPFPAFHYGDVVELRGKLQTPPSFQGFDYREYLARKGIALG